MLIGGLTTKLANPAIVITANPYQGILTHANTLSDKTYTFPDKSGVVALITDLNRTGFPDRTSTTLTWNAGTRTITLAPVGSNFTVSVNGTTYTKTTQTSTIPNVTGGYFIYFDNTGTLQQTTTPWNILIIAPIAYVYWDATLGDGFAFEERHTDAWTPSEHYYHHFISGTEALSGFAATGYDLAGAGGNATNAFNTYAIATGEVADEDIILSTSALADGGPYTIFNRTGATGTWTWTKTNTIPFKVGTTFPQYNQWTGATWQMTEGASLRYINYFVYATTSLNPLFQYIIIPGQNIYTSLALAKAETYATLQLGALPFQEIVPLYQITLRTGAGVAYNGATGSCRIEAFARITGSKTSINQAAITNHEGLVGLLGGDSTDGHFHLNLAQYTVLSTVSGGVNATGAIVTGSGGNSVYLDPTNGSIYANAMVNRTSLDNALISVPITGPLISRNVADANSALTVNLINASSTGKILDLQFGGVSKASINNAGNISTDGVVSANGYMSVNSAASTPYFELKNAGIRRFLIYNNSTGSNTQFIMYDGTGTLVDSAITIQNVANGAITFSATRPITGLSFNLITGLASVVSPVNGTAAVGTSTTVARQDHVHGTDTTRAQDSLVVHLAGTETITGVKSFTGNTNFANVFVALSAAYDQFHVSSHGTPGQGITFECINVARNGYTSLRIFASAWNLHNGTADIVTITSTGNITATQFIKSGGTSAQFLKADGSVDSSTYSTTAHNHTGVYQPLATNLTSIGALANAAGVLSNNGTGTFSYVALPTVNAGTLGASAATAGATNTTVALNFSAAWNANSASNVTINPVVGPSITALAALMTGATTGFLKKTAADTYTLDTSTYLTGTKVDSFNTRTGAVTLTSADVITALTFTPYNATNPSSFIALSAVTDAVVTAKLLTSLPAVTNVAIAATDSILAAMAKLQGQINNKQASGTYLTSIGVTTANGVSGTSSGGATPNLTITLGAITPTSVATGAAGLRASSWTGLGTTYSAAQSIFGNNVYVDAADTVSGQVRTAITHATYGHSYIQCYNGQVDILGKSESVTAGAAVVKNLLATFSSTGATFYIPIIKSGGTASQFLKANGTVDSNTYALSTHMTHSWVDGTYYYEDYTQGKNYRTLFQTALSDTIRYCPISVVEYWNGAAWVAWVGGDAIIRLLLDGREDTGVQIDHTHRKFRFVVDKSTGWPLQTVFVIQSLWTGFTRTDITVTLENNVASVWTVRDTCVFSAANTGPSFGIHAKAQSTLHDGNAQSRITVDITDWVDVSTYTTYPITNIHLFSNYTGAGIEPWTWDYYKNVTFPAIVTATSIVKSGGTSAQFLKADGSVDSSTYLTALPAHTLDSHSNVTITANSAGEILKWSGTAWINNTLAEAGIQPAGTYLTGTKVDSFNTRTGAVTLTSSDVTTALTFTPYNSTNPNSFIALSAVTDAVVTGKVLTSLPAVTNVAIAATDTILAAMAKLQGQINNKQASGTYLTAETDTLATVTGRGATTTVGSLIIDSTGRAITIGVSGSIKVKAQAGGWANAWMQTTSTGTDLAGWGFFGSTDALSYIWAGPAYNSNWLQINSSGATFAGYIYNGDWYYGKNANNVTQELIRARGTGYSQTAHPGIQIGKTGDHIALFIDPVSITGGSFNGTTNEIFMPNTFALLQANAGGTDWQACLQATSGVVNFTNTPTVAGSAVITSSTVGSQTVYAASRVDTIMLNSTTSTVYLMAGSVVNGTYGYLYGNGSVYMNTGIVYASDFSASSDERLKENWEDLPIDFVSQLSKVKVGTYHRIDNDKMSIGASAQSLQKCMPLAVRAGEDEMLSISYGNAALVSAVELAKEVEKLKEKIAILEERLVS